MNIHDERKFMNHSRPFNSNCLHFYKYCPYKKKLNLTRACRKLSRILMRRFSNINPIKNYKYAKRKEEFYFKDCLNFYCDKNILLSLVLFWEI